jgi:hypothetical protein
MPARLWSELQPWERRAELAKVHPELHEDCLIASGRLVPELRPQIDAQKSKEDKLKIVLRYFGDERHPEPETRARRGPAINGNPVIECPHWERLPRLEDETDQLQRRDPLPTRATTEAVRLRVIEKESWPKIEESLVLSHRKVDYVRKALKHGDLGWDLDRDCLTLGPETRNTPAGLVLPAR